MGILRGRNVGTGSNSSKMISATVLASQSAIRISPNSKGPRVVCRAEAEKKEGKSEEKAVATKSEESDAPAESEKPKPPEPKLGEGGRPIMPWTNAKGYTLQEMSNPWRNGRDAFNKDKIVNDRRVNGIPIFQAWTQPYLDGTLPGDEGYDPLKMFDPEAPVTGFWRNQKWIRMAEIFHCRLAMVGLVGMITPEIFAINGGKFEAPLWWQTGWLPGATTATFWTDPITLFTLQMALVGFVEMRRFQDYVKPGSMGEAPFLGNEKEQWGGSGDPAYPGGPVFDPMKLAYNKSEKTLFNLKTKEIRNGRLAMLAVLGCAFQAMLTPEHKGPVQNLLDHLEDPNKNNLFQYMRDAGAAGRALQFYDP